MLLFAASSCSNSSPYHSLMLNNDTAPLYAQEGQEYQVHFQALYKSNYKRIDQIQDHITQSSIIETTQFLFGPLTNRSLGGVQKGQKITLLREKIYIEGGLVIIPYQYEGVWMLNRNKVSGDSLILPLPFSADELKKTNWLSCTDKNDEDHRTWSFLWYFWDPERPGCQHRKNSEYQLVQVSFGTETEQTRETYPEYKNMIHMVNGIPTMAMTFAFGYVEDAEKPKPFQDSDYGAREFQKFYNQSKNILQSMGFSETPITQNQFSSGNLKIGSLFTGNVDGTRFQVSIVAAAGVDQMDIFANSFAQRHEGFFGWFGHSRVGSGFDADNFKYILNSNPQRFTMSSDYQLVYWAGCNSYSYYTLPFFELKANIEPIADPNGTKKLDIISNTLPSLFAFNSGNASIMLKTFLNTKERSSYQSIIEQITKLAYSSRAEVIVNVLGDEDNAP